MTTFATGRQAEAVAAEYLRGHGFKVVEQNYRTRWCEIDIVAQHGDVIVFVEVKYRSHNTQGSGLDYITPSKLRQMRYAAEHWASEKGWDKAIRLGAIEVGAPDYRVLEFIDDIALDA